MFLYSRLTRRRRAEKTKKTPPSLYFSGTLYRRACSVEAAIHWTFSHANCRHAQQAEDTIDCLTNTGERPYSAAQPITTTLEVADEMQ